MDGTIGYTTWLKGYGLLHCSRKWTSPFRQPQDEISKTRRNAFLTAFTPQLPFLCGRALERLIKEKSGAQMIGKGLVELKSKGVIDDQLFNWAEALRKERNIGAHASDEDITKDNAQDIIDFTIAIFEYVYTLTEKYEKYLIRKGNRPKQSG